MIIAEKQDSKQKRDEKKEESDGSNHVSFSSARLLHISPITVLVWQPTYLRRTSTSHSASGQNEAEYVMTNTPAKRAWI